MDAEEIQKRLVTLSQRNFRRVVALILKRVLNYDSINVDGSGDGGSDWLAYQQGGQRLRLAMQDTVQAGWEKKALDDAKKAKKELGVNSYLFFTNRPHQQTTATQLENKITRETELSCSVFEARRISELIYERGLGGEFLAALGEAAASRPPEMPEMCLCAYSNLSADRQNHRDEIYRDTLRVACYEADKPLQRNEIVNAAIGFLATNPMQRPLLEKQLERLLSKGELRKTSDGTLELTPATKKTLAESEQLYLSDWAGLESAQMQMMKAYGSTTAWSADDSRQAAVFVSRMFLQQQFDLLRHARVDNLIANWSSRLGSPEQQLRDLLQQRGISLSKIRNAIEELVALAKGRDVVAKLTRTVTFVALEGRDPVLSAAALGRRSWDEVHVLVDSSVAIPFLCEQLNEASATYHFSLSGNAVRLFQELKSACCMIAGHVEECAAHLINAYRYEPVQSDKDLASALRLSENAFIAYYGALKAEGRVGEQTLPQFLAAFSRRAASAAREFSDVRQAARAVMPEIQDLLNAYHVPCRAARHLSLDRFGALQKSFDNACIETGRDRHPILREHDVDALAHLGRSTESEGESWMMLTWDKTFIHVAQRELPSAFVVSPEMAMDFAQTCRRLSDTQWCALAHRLAKISSPSDELTARILDQVTRLNPDKLRDASFRKQLLDFRDQALQTLPTDDDTKFHAWVEGQAKTFLKEQNVTRSEPASTP
jgi:hypothetical protein